MKKKWKGWLCLCLAFAVSFAILPAAVSADNQFAGLRLYTGFAKVASDMFVSGDTGTYGVDVNEHCPAGYKKDGYRLWRLDEGNYTVASRWVSDNEQEWAAYLTGYYAPEHVMLAPNWTPEYSAEPITSEDPTVVIGDGSAQDRGDFYYQWMRERKVVDIGNYYDGSKQVKALGSVNAVYNSEYRKWVAGKEQPYIEVRFSLQRGDVVTVKDIAGGTDPQNYFSGYLKTPNGSACLETYDHKNEVFYATAPSGGECILHMQNNLSPNSLQAAVTVSRYEAEDGEAGSKTYSGEDGTYCCKISYIRDGSQISFFTNAVTINKNGSGEDDPKEYAVTKGAKPEHGSFAAKINGKEIDKALPGQTVTVETYPFAGYKTQAITYRKTEEAIGGPITVPMGGDGNGCFVMPKYDVTVEVSFCKEQPEVKPSQPPKVEIRLEGSNYIWDSFMGKVSFDIMANKARRFHIKVSDPENDLDDSAVKYYLANGSLFLGNKDYSPEEIENAVGGRWIDKADTVDLKADGRYVLYVKASDKAGNTTYANSQGIVIDTKAPVVFGVKDQGKYYGTTKFMVSDVYLGTVSVDGKKVEPDKGVYAIAPDNAPHTIEATDLAGNKASCKVFVYETWVRDGIKKSGKYTLQKGVAYKLGKGKWKIAGDSAIYRGGTMIYVPDSGDYNFRKQ